MRRASAAITAAASIAVFGLAGVHAVSAEPGNNAGPVDNAQSAKPKCTIVLVYYEGCKNSCQRVRPIIHDLADKYADKVKYMELM